MTGDHLITARISHIGECLSVLHQRLIESGYRFADESCALPGPDGSHVQAVARIEAEIGTVPLAVRQFWEIIGSVDYRGSHPEWKGCEYPDPVFVFPASIAEEELDEFLADYDERMRCDFPYLIPIAPDSYHKEDVSGGMWYNVSCPAEADDPPLNDEWHHTTFLMYLEICLQYAGFPGLADAPDHNWPIHELARGL